LYVLGKGEGDGAGKRSQEGEVSGILSLPGEGDDRGLCVGKERRGGSPRDFCKVTGWSGNVQHKKLWHLKIANGQSGE